MWCWKQNKDEIRFLCCAFTENNGSRIDTNKFKINLEFKSNYKQPDPVELSRHNENEKRCWRFLWVKTKLGWVFIRFTIAGKLRGCETVWDEKFVVWKALMIISEILWENKDMKNRFLDWQFAFIWCIWKKLGRNFC